MIVRNLEARCIGSRQAVDAAQKLMSKGDARHLMQVRSALSLNLISRRPFRSSVFELKLMHCRFCCSAAGGDR